MKSLLSNRIFRQIGLASLIKAGMAVLTLVLFFALARAMTVEEYGFFGFGFSLVQVLAIVATGGLHVLIFRWIPETRKAHGEAAAQAVMRRWLKVVSVFGLGAGALFILGSLLFVREAGQTGYYVALGTMITSFVITEYLSSALRAQGQIVNALVPRDIYWRGGLSLLFFVVALLGRQMSASPVLWIISGTLAAVALFQIRLVLKAEAAPEVPERPRQEVVAQMLPVWLGSLINGTARNRDVMILGVMLDPTVLGPYFVASRVANALNLATVAANSVSANIISEAYYENRHGGLDRNVRKITATTASLTAAGAAVLLPGAWFILSAFGQEYATAVPELVILVIATLLASCLGPVHYILQLTGRERLNLAIITGGAVVALVLQVVLILEMGTVGGALGTACSVVVPRLVAYYFVRKEMGIDPSILSVLKRVLKR